MGCFVLFLLVFLFARRRQNAWQGGRGRSKGNPEAGKGPLARREPRVCRAESGAARALQSRPESSGEGGRLAARGAPRPRGLRRSPPAPRPRPGCWLGGTPRPGGGPHSRFRHPSLCLLNNHQKRPLKKHTLKRAGLEGKANACFRAAGALRGGPGRGGPGRPGSSAPRPPPPPPPPAGAEAPAPGQREGRGWLEEVPLGCGPRLSVLATEKQQAKNPGALQKREKAWGQRSRRLGGRGWSVQRGRWEEAPGSAGATRALPPVPPVAAGAAKPLVL